MRGYLPAPDHENTIALIRDLKGKFGIQIGARPIMAIVPEVADALYELVRSTSVRKGKNERPRTAEMVAAVSRCWEVIRRLPPGPFNKEVCPWGRRGDETPALGHKTGRDTRLCLPSSGAVNVGHFDAASGRGDLL
ncbi:hypothetical protein GGQ85_000195 [Nitrobacter vulgaris]|uniref:hypothetical protein n=1 Tax=Nitrobacter vulgaris TaxID=29421 RepID=UPI00285ECC91|nr:hypothetical protein [Nitrobacter vulgaris]MDR6302524.1 hypothetical protein [Nitrobacter vulgaris]